MIDKLSHSAHKEFLKSLLLGNRMQSSALAHTFLNQPASIKELYEDIIKNALYDVGELWEYNKISVATEHLASAIVEAILNELYPNVISTEKINRTAITACVENEFHQIGIKMVNDIFEMNGWKTHFLGANTPTTELISFAKTIKPDILSISVSLYFHLPILEKMIILVRNDFPKLPILVGGQAFRKGGQEILLKYENVTYKPDLNSTELFIKNLS